MTATLTSGKHETVQDPPRATRSKRRKHSNRVAGLIVRYVILCLVAVLLIGPLIVPLLSAFKGQGEDLFGVNATLLPQHWSLDAFATLFRKIPILTYIGNSVTIAVLYMASHLILAVTSGYMLSRPGWRGRGTTFLILMGAMIFPFESIMVSLFTQVRDMGLVDSLIGVWLPGIVGVMNIFLMRSAFLAVPDEIEDAAVIDGANEFTRFWRIFLPQAKGMMVVIALMSFIFAWDDFLWPLIVLRSDSHFTLMLGLTQLQGAFGFDYRVVLAGALTAFLPIAILFFIGQKHFFRGMEEGGVKL